MNKTGKALCECGGTIIGNYGKVIYKPVGMIICWNPECNRIYDYDVVDKIRKEGSVVMFILPGSDLKVYQMNSCDWWLDFSLEEAVINYREFTKTESIDNPSELTDEQLRACKFKTQYGYPENYTFMDELQRAQSMRSIPTFFASTEY